MIVLDTDVLSALASPQPPVQVIQWVNAQPAQSVWITSITLFEVRTGVAQLPAGRRRQMLEAALSQLLEEDLEGRVLAFDDAAAEAAAILDARRRRAGRPMDIRDTQIAGIVVARRATLATRNTRHFEDLPDVLNPWDLKSK